MGLYQRISKSKNLNIYSSGFWNFVAGQTRSLCFGDCQNNAALYESNEKLFVYGFSTINNLNMISELKGQSLIPAASRVDNAGAVMDGLFNTASVAGYFR